MELKIALVLMALVSTSYCSIVLGNMSDMTPDARPAKPEELPTTLPPSTPSTGTPQTTTTTVAPKTTTEAPKTTTEAPKTTTVAPKTTTEAPKTTTEPPKTTTTTDAPKTTTVPPKTTADDPKTTTAPSTTSPAPNTTTTPVPVTTTPTPLDQSGVWIVKSNNMTCIVTKMAISANVTYPTTNGTKFVVLMSEGSPNATIVNGTCGENIQSLDIPLFGGHIFTVTFESNATDKRYNISSTRLLVIPNDLPDVKDNNTVLQYDSKVAVFDVPLNMSYKCSQITALNLTSLANLTALITLKDTQIEAFRKESAVKFGNAQDCATADTPDYVPLAVGVSLVVMIVVVLVAYLIGRRRSSSRGYVSM